MNAFKRFIAAVALAFFALCAGAWAQTPAVSTVNITPDSDKVRVYALGDVTGMRLEVSDEAGDIVFESGQLTGRVLDWEMRDSQGERVAPGTYTVTVSYRMPSGKLRKRVEQVTVTEEVTTVESQDNAGAQAASSPTPSAVATITGDGTTNRIAKFTGPNTIDDSVMTESAGKIGLNTIAPTHALTVNGGPAWTTANWLGSIALPNLGAVGWNTNSAGQRRGFGHNNGGLHFFRTASNPGSSASPAVYDLTINNTGNVGVGTTVPASKLSVNGDIQILGSGHGIKFPDGTVQTTKAVSGSGSSLTGAGTAGSLVKFTGTSSMANSVIKENGGNVGIGTATPAEKLHLSGTRSVLRLQSTAANQWSAIDYVTDGRSWHTGVGGSQVPNDLRGKFYIFDATAQQIRMVVDTQGRVGIGTTDPQNGKLQVEVGVSTALFARSAKGDGVRGIGDSGHYGVYGNGGVGVYGFSEGGVGVRGVSDDGYAGSFAGKVLVEGTFINNSDRHAKTNISSINPRSILEKLTAIPIQTWNYKSEPASIRHIGPMAQDFRAAFQLGVDDKGISNVDADGVALASIQALYQMMQEKDRQIEQLQSLLNQVRRTIRRRRAPRR